MVTRRSLRTDIAPPFTGPTDGTGDRRDWSVRCKLEHRRRVRPVGSGTGRPDEYVWVARGSVEIESAGPITFGPAGILFLADNGAATIFAVDVDDPGSEAGPEPFDLENVDARGGVVPGL